MFAILSCAGLCALTGAVGLAEGLDEQGGLTWFWIVVLALAGLQGAGALAISLGRRRLGAMVVLVSALPLVPLGLLGAWGARSVLDDAAAARFRAQRRSCV